MAQPPLIIFATKAEVAVHFWPHVDIQEGPALPGALGPCWPWTRGRDGYGYGVFYSRGKQHKAHRVSWLLSHEPPGELCVLHHCDNPICVRPSHLFVGTKTDNAADCKAKGRHARGNRSAASLYPDRRPRGDRHGARLHPESRPRGEQHKNSRLTAHQVVCIRAAHTDGKSMRSLALEFRVSRPTIKAVVCQCTWKHI